MPFQPINYANIQPQGSPWLRNLFDNLASGYQIGQMPAQMERDAQKQRLLNAFQEMKNQEEPQRFSSEQLNDKTRRAFEEAQIGKINREASLPFGGKIPPGSIGQAIWVDMIGKQYGSNSPQYIAAKTAYDTDLHKEQTLDAYYNKLLSTADKRASSPLAKVDQDLEDAQEGFMPGTGRTKPISGNEQQDIVNTLMLDRQKKVSDYQTRAKTLYAKNIEATIGQIDSKDLTQYGGLNGQLKLKADTAAASVGRPPDRYLNYQKAVTNAQLMAKQVRQFYGDSIQPSVGEELNYLSNPVSWTNDPKTALTRYNAFIKTLGIETGTYTRALKSPSAYEGVPTPPNKFDGVSTEELMRQYKRGKK